MTVSRVDEIKAKITGEQIGDEADDYYDFEELMDDLSWCCEKLDALNERFGHSDGLPEG